MSMLFLLCLIIWTLQSMTQDRGHGYINELCNGAKAYAQASEFELALHWCNTAAKFYGMRKLDNITSLCKIWTQLGKVHYKRWLKQRVIQDLAGASENFRKAKEYSYIPALEAFGKLSMECGNFEEAVKHLEAVLRDDFNIVKNNRRVGICYKETGDYKKAVKFFGRAYTLGDQESFTLAQSL